MAEHPPADLVERVRAAMSEVLGTDVGAGQDFFVQGGDSLAAALVAVRLAEPGAEPVELGRLFGLGATPTLVAAGLAGEAVRDGAQAVELRRPGSDGAPLVVWIVQHARQAQLARGVARRLASPAGLVMLTAPPAGRGLDLDGIEDWYGRAIDGLSGSGPLWLAGACLGPVAALELASRRDGVAGVVAVDSGLGSELSPLGRARWHIGRLREAGPRTYVAERLRRGATRVGALVNPDEVDESWLAAERALGERAFDGPGVLIRTRGCRDLDECSRRPWRTRFREVTAIDMPGDHGILYQPEGLDAIAAGINATVAGWGQGRAGERDGSAQQIA